MRKILLVILIIFLFVVAALIAGRNLIVKASIVKGIEAAAGVGVQIEKVDIGLFSSYVNIDSLKVYNPSEFTDRLMLDIPQIYVDYDLAGFLNNKVHLKKLKIEIKELSAVLNEKGKLNFNSLALILPKPSGQKPPEIKIDELSLKIGKVRYKGNFPAIGTKIMEFTPNIDETFNNVTNPSQVAGDILKRILARIGISDFAKFDIGDQVTQIKQQAQAALGKSVEETKSTAKELESTAKQELEKTKADLKNIFSK